MSNPSNNGPSGNDSGCQLMQQHSTSKKVRRFFDPDSPPPPHSEDSEEESSSGQFNSLICPASITDDENQLSVEIHTEPITIYAPAPARPPPISNRVLVNDLINNSKSRSAGPCSPNNSSSESSTFSSARTEIPRFVGTRKHSAATTPSGIPVRKFGAFTFGYRSQSAFSLLAPQTAGAHSGHQHQSKSRLANMPCPAKKQNKWDAVMSKIAETKNKPINVRDIKSRVYCAVKGMSAPTAPMLGPRASDALNNQRSANNNNNRKSSFSLGNSAKFRHRQLLQENEHFSSQSSTMSVSDSSSLDEHHLRGNRVIPPRPQAQPRVKKDGVPVKSRRQMSDLSSASDYSTHASQAVDHQPPPPRRKPRSTATRVSAAKSHSSLVTPTAPLVPVSNDKAHPVGTNGHNYPRQTRRVTCGVVSGANLASTRAPLSSARNVVPTTNGATNAKTHPVKPLRDRNRMAPAGKAIPMDTGPTNGPRGNGNGGQQNGGSNEQLPDLNSADTPDGNSTIVPIEVKVEKIDCSTQVSLPSHFGNGRLIEDLTMSEEDSDPGMINNNNSSRRNSNAHHQCQNAVILENTSLKEEIHQMSMLIEKLQEQLKVLTSNYEKQKAQVGANKAELAVTNSKFVAMSLVAQNCDLQRILASRRLSTVQDRCLIQEQEKVEDTKRELCSKFQEDRDSHKEQIASLSKNYEREMRELEVYYEDRLSRVKETNDTVVADLRRIHEEDMQRLEANYRREMDDMKRKHEEHLADQIKKTPGDILHKEIDSLEVVIEIRNQVIKDLRVELLEAQTKMEGLIQTVEQNKGLAAKVEDLEAQLEKTRRDKSKIFEKLNTMETSMSQVVTENDRLHLYTEELTWRIETLKTDDHVNQSMSKSAIEFGTSYSSD